MTEPQATKTDGASSYLCSVCGASSSGGTGVVVGLLRCWRDDCPGSDPKRPLLKIVRT